MNSTEATRIHAQDILDFIHEHPEKHDQNHYIAGDDGTGCGTSMCIAGTSAWLHRGAEAQNISHLIGIGIDNYDTLAAKALGLNIWEAEVLFHDYNNERAIQKLKKVVVGEEFSRDDFYTGYADDTDRLDDNEYQWEQHLADQGLDKAEVID